MPAPPSLQSSRSHVSPSIASHRSLLDPNLPAPRRLASSTVSPGWQYPPCMLPLFHPTQTELRSLTGPCCCRLLHRHMPSKPRAALCSRGSIAPMHPGTGSSRDCEMSPTQRLLLAMPFQHLLPLAFQGSRTRHSLTAPLPMCASERPLDRSKGPSIMTR